MSRVLRAVLEMLSISDPVSRLNAYGMLQRSEIHESRGGASKVRRCAPHIIDPTRVDFARLNNGSSQRNDSRRYLVCKLNTSLIAPSNLSAQRWLLVAASISCPAIRIRSAALGYSSQATFAAAFRS
jgi:hypothetical protein